MVLAFYYLCFVDVFAFSEIDNEGVIEPDTDEPQEMGEVQEVGQMFIVSKKCAYINLNWYVTLSSGSLAAD